MADATGPVAGYLLGFAHETFFAGGLLEPGGGASEELARMTIRNSTDAPRSLCFRGLACDYFRQIFLARLGLAW